MCQWEDQKQHLELTRDIATKFNNDYKVPNFFCPEPIIEKTSPRIMSLRDGSKMSKSETSDMSRINLTDVSDQIALKIRKARQTKILYQKIFLDLLLDQKLAT